ARSTDPARNGGLSPDYVYGDDLKLRNSIDTLVLVAPDGTVVDRVRWDDGRTFPDPDGASMSLRDPDADNAEGAAWCSATTVFGAGDLGSPGGPNRCSGSSAPIVVTEILQNPAAVSDDAGEWFELHNPGDVAVDLAGWTFRDEDTDRFVVDRSLVVPPGGYVVLGRSADRATNGRVAVDYAYGEAMRLHNSADELLVVDADGVLVDRVAWDDGLTFPDPNGASMSLTDPTLDNARGGNWCVSTVARGALDLATPGRPNDCTTPDVPSRIVITEIFQNPYLVGDRAGEWFELHNPGPDPVDLEGWTIRDDDRDAFVVEGSLVVPPGGYVVFAEVADPAANGGVDADYAYGDGMILSNGADELVLVDPRGRVVDRVAWDDGLTFPDPNGASMSLTDPTLDNAAGGVWCVAATPYGDGDLGTPGAPTDCTEVVDYGRVIVTEVMQNPFRVGDDDGEWFEVYNPGREPVDLNGWMIADDGSERHRITAEGPLVVEPRSYLVLGRSADPTRNGGAPVAYAYGRDLRLSNGADEVILVDPRGRVVTRVAWDGGPRFPDPNGASMALRGFRKDPTDPASWCESRDRFGAGDRGSPGSRNRCKRPAGPPPQIVINEIMQNPAASFDSVGEWFELYNRTREPVDLSGWIIRDDDWDTHVISPDAPLVIEPRGYLVLARSTDPARNGGVPADYAYGHDLILFNGRDELVLLDPDLRVVDEVRWDDGRTFPDPIGASMALRNPNRPNHRGGAWCTARTPYGAGDLGTPGARNDCRPRNPCPLATLR
ncbi:MAG TPA: lamin tail domain-containing protein, partial [Actinobacteria bacterium]|nr:lamin tail domain-containing protein [Actinomycetota bacterium]